MHGTDRYAAAIEQTIATAAIVTMAIRGSSHLQLIREPELSVILFERPGLSDSLVTHPLAGSCRLAPGIRKPETTAGQAIDILGTLR